jgi:hypothetical protein
MVRLFLPSQQRRTHGNIEKSIGLDLCRIRHRVRCGNRVADMESPALLLAIACIWHQKHILGGNMKLRTIFRTILVTAALAVMSIAASAQNFNQQGVTLTAPVALTTSGPAAGTTDSGLPYTSTIYSGTLPNTDMFVVGIAEYNAAVNYSDLSKFGDAFVASAKGKILKSSSLTVGGLPALGLTVEVLTGDRTLRIAWVGVVKGNRAYQFVFGSYMDVQSNMDQVNTFFNSITIS